MFQYKLNKSLKWYMFERKDNPYYWESQWAHQKEFLDELRVKDYSDRQRIIHAFRRRFVCFYSPKYLDKIPVYGYLIPVEFFDVEEI